VGADPEIQILVPGGHAIKRVRLFKLVSVTVFPATSTVPSPRGQSVVWRIGGIPHDAYIGVG
jgi:hypothetical protein